jgi:hypothetical protein
VALVLPQVRAVRALNLLSDRVPPEDRGGESEGFWERRQVVETCGGVMCEVLELQRVPQVTAEYDAIDNM